MTRENAINHFTHAIINEEYPLTRADKEEILRTLTSTDRPAGEWEVKDNMWWACSNCGCRTRMMKKYNVPNYCPACGAKMAASTGG